MTNKGKASIACIVLGVLLYLLHCGIYGFEIVPWDERLPILAMYLFGFGIGVRVGTITEKGQNSGD